MITNSEIRLVTCVEKF